MRVRESEREREMARRVRRNQVLQPWTEQVCPPLWNIGPNKVNLVLHERALYLPRRGQEEYKT